MCFPEFVAASKTGPQERSQDTFLSESTTSKRQYSGQTETDDLELPLFDFDALTKATDDFSNANKLGQGGFGCVYKVCFKYVICTIFLNSHIF